MFVSPAPPFPRLSAALIFPFLQQPVPGFIQRPADLETALCNGGTQIFPATPPSVCGAWRYQTHFGTCMRADGVAAWQRPPQQPGLGSRDSTPVLEAAVLEGARATRWRKRLGRLALPVSSFTPRAIWASIVTVDRSFVFVSAALHCPCQLVSNGIDHLRCLVGRRYMTGMSPMRLVPW